MLLAVGMNSILTVFSQELNHAFQKRPFLLLIDLILAALLMALTGGWRSPYYLYALNPLLAAAFFFRLKGAILATTIFLPFYFLAIIGNIGRQGAPPDFLVVLTAVVGAYLISGAFGYAALLLGQLQKTRDNLYSTNLEMQVLQKLTTALQRAADMPAVQESVLAAVTSDLGFPQAAIGLIDENGAVIDDWRVQRPENGRSTQTQHAIINPHALDDAGSPIAKAVKTQQIRRTPRAANSGNSKPCLALKTDDCLIIPLIWGMQPVGVLLIDIANQPDQNNQYQLLEAIARQTAVSLGMMMTRLRRAKESAIQEERSRIALDLHDTISQSLFGIVYTLQGCLTLLEKDPQAVKPELRWALGTAQDVRQKIRHTIHNMWPRELTATQFETDLRTYAVDVLQANNLEINFDIRGDFGALSPPARRSMYRICQEALTNVVHHAAANESRICVDVDGGRARLLVRDNGRGFDPALALSQTHAGEHFGLRGMQERAKALGGTCKIYSQPAAGASIVIDFPANTQAHHE